MTWQTHAVVGANAVWLTSLTGQVDHSTPVLIAVGALAGLLPDIDASGRGARVHFLFGGLLKGLRNKFKHRGFFHSVMATVILFVASFFLLSSWHPLLPWVISLGYFSHPFIDGFNSVGVQYLYPLKKKHNLIPEALQTPVGGWWDGVFMLLGTFGIMSFIFLYFNDLDFGQLVSTL